MPRGRCSAGWRFAVAAGEIVALVGESGVGKSTLLNCIAGLEDADAGAILIGPRDALDIVASTKPARAALRATRIGFVFQAFHVLPTLTVAQNIAVPLLLNGVAPAQHAPRIEALLARVGLAGFGPRWPAHAVGRRTAARGDRPRAGAPAGADPGRRADRQPRPAHRRRNARPAARTRARGRHAGALIVTHSQHVAQSCDRILTLTPDGLQ
jgi:putative ABC transport system ATP-binding protein